MRKNKFLKAVVFAIAGIPFNAISIHAQVPAAPLTLRRTILLSEVTGKFDHFAIDEEGDRLFAAAEGSHAVEIIDLATGKIAQSLSGLGKPHGLAWVAASGSLYVTDGALAELRVYKGKPLALAGTIKLSDDADDVVYDSADRLLFVGHGGGADQAKVAVVDTDHFVLISNLAVATHPEGLDLDPNNRRVFVNIADSSEVAVISSAAGSIMTHWRVSTAADNVPLAFDGDHQLLFVACRAPGTLVALDVVTGKEVASRPAAGKADDLFYDSALRRVYLISGTGEVDSFQVEDARTLRPLEVLRTAPGAKTALFVPSQKLLYVGVPAIGAGPAEIRVYSTSGTGAAQ